MKKEKIIIAVLAIFGLLAVTTATYALTWGAIKVGYREPAASDTTQAAPNTNVPPANTNTPPPPAK